VATTSFVKTLVKLLDIQIRKPKRNHQFVLGWLANTDGKAKRSNVKVHGVGERDKLEAELAAARAALEPFARIAHGIPDNCPGQCHLRIDCDEAYTREWLSYLGVNDCSDVVLPTIEQWRAAQAAGGEGCTRR
jgi:hypothetical protein